jgi:hypothetical protein
MRLCGAPHADNQTDRVLQQERASNVKEIQSTVRLAGNLGRKIFVEYRVAENRRGADARKDGPDQIGGHGQAQYEREQRGREGQSDRGKHDLGANAEPAEPVGRDAEQEGAGAERQRHHQQVTHDGGALEAFNVREPRRGPQPLERPGRADA